MKLATWNLALPVAPARRAAVRTRTDQVAADVWVFTEAHDGFTPDHPYSCSSAAGRDGLHKPAHRWVTIWSKWRLEPLVTVDNVRTVAARVFPETEVPFLIYGTVLPWAGSKWRGHSAAGGEAFVEALKVQVTDWHQLRRDYPDDELFVLGDFNQDLVQPRYCGTQVTRGALVSALHECGLVALTAGEGDPIRRDSAPFACIDHICVLRDTRWWPEPAVRWPNAAKPERQISDHFGVAVTLSQNQPYSN